MAVEPGTDLPRPHSRADGEQWPPDGTAQPRTPDEQAGIGLSYPAGQDFGPYVQALGRCPVMWREVVADLRCDVPFSAGNVHPHTGLLLFALAVNLRPKVIIETGTFFGYSTWFLAEALRWWGDGKVYSIDPDMSHVPVCVRDHPHVCLVQGRSQDVLPKLLPEVQRVDMVFLDSYKRMALAEFGLMEPAVTPGGLVAFHDTQVFNTGRALHRKLSRLDGWDSCLFAGTPSEGDPHSFFGNADDRGLLLLRRREAHPFLDVADHGTYSERLGDALLERNDPGMFFRREGGKVEGFRVAPGQESVRLFRLCVVTGVPRSGTSLACDLVEVCGWSLGPVDKAADPRSRRNHLGRVLDITGKSLVNVAAPRLRHLRGLLTACASGGIEAAKLVVDPAGWLAALRPHVDRLKVVVCTRDPREAVLSHVEHALFVNAGEEYPGEDLLGTTIAAAEGVTSRVRAVEQLLANEAGLKVMELPFAQVVEKDAGLLSRLAEFLEVPACDRAATVRRMQKIIQPEVSRFCV